jgi:hypothetical protein
LGVLTVGRDLKKLACYIQKINRQSQPKIETILGQELNKFSISDRYRFIGRALREGKDVQWRMMLDLLRGEGRKWIEPNE